MSRRPQLVVALDLSDPAAALDMADALRGEVDLVKVGLELYLRAGRSLVEALIDRGHRIFLDVKLHDIPATVVGAMGALADLDLEMLTLHVGGGRAMVEAAVDARGVGERPLLLGVTVLTSLSAEEVEGLGFQEDPDTLAARWARLARSGGCDGVVASPREAATLKEAHGEEFAIVTPGIRPRGTVRGDQARVATPAEAVRAGSDYLVVGRPILRAEDPVGSAAAIRDEMERAMESIDDGR